VPVREIDASRTRAPVVDCGKSVRGPDAISGGRGHNQRIRGTTYRDDVGEPTLVRGGAEVAVRGTVRGDNLEIAAGTTVRTTISGT
jgi:hypothetical protein